MIDVRKMYLKEMKRKQSTDYEFAKDEDRRICCPVCSKEIKEDHLKNVEYVKTKRGSEIFVHHDCVKKWGM